MEGCANTFVENILSESRKPCTDILIYNKNQNVFKKCNIMTKIYIIFAIMNKKIKESKY